MRRFVRCLSTTAPARPPCVLGIETSCDDTAIGIVCADRGVLASVNITQFATHVETQGINPAVAARAHVQNLPLVLQRALGVARVRFADLTHVAVTAGPGLNTCLHAGMDFARRVSGEHQLPLLSIHHLEAHILVSRLQDHWLAPSERKPKFPFMSLLVSGGHTQLILVRAIGDYSILGSTTDDSVGECFDKVARMLGQYGSETHPGRSLELLAERGMVTHKWPIPRFKKGKTLDFSYAGLKTAVRLKVEALSKDGVLDPQEAANVAASFQHAAFTQLIQKAKDALVKYPEIQTMVVCGGVAANMQLREKLAQMVTALGVHLVVPPQHLCVDSGVMIAWNALERLQCNMVPEPQEQPLPRWPLGETVEYVAPAPSEPAKRKVTHRSTVG